MHFYTVLLSFYTDSAAATCCTVHRSTLLRETRVSFALLCFHASVLGGKLVGGRLDGSAGSILPKSRTSLAEPSVHLHLLLTLLCVDTIL